MNLLCKTLLATTVLPLGLAGCQSDYALSKVVRPQSTLASTTIQKTYQCDNGKLVKAIYDNSDVNQSKVSLLIGGKSYQLTQIIAASGARYITAQGLVSGQGLEWHSKGASAIASSVALSNSSSADQQAVLFSCSEK